MLIRRWPAVMLALLAGVLVVSGGAGCSQSRIFTISTRPPGAEVTVDSVDRGRAPITVEIAFLHADDIHHASAKRQGFEENTILITPDESKRHLMIDLEPLKRDVTFRTNVPAYISIDGKRVTKEPVTSYEARRMAMGIDTKTNVWNKHVVIAE